MFKNGIIIFWFTWCITVWKTNSGTIATSGYYLSVDKKADNTYVDTPVEFTTGISGSETWTFELEDGTTVTKTVLLGA